MPETSFNHIPDRTIYINLDHLSHNLEYIRTLAPQKDILAFVKADAYGHGIVQIVGKLYTLGVTQFAVASPLELIELRIVFPEIKIVVCSSYYSASTLQCLAHYRGDMVVFHPEHIALLECTHLDSPINVWFKINIGMNRMGFPVNDFHENLARLQECKHINAQNTVLMGHFACADEYKQVHVQKQIDLFHAQTESIPLKKSLANSAATVHYPNAHCDIIRPGLLLYGISPLASAIDLSDKIKPVMTVCSRIVTINVCHKGATVGYSATWTAPRDSRIAIVAMGYADGYPVSASNKCQVAIKGQYFNVVGRVSMDTLAVDITNSVADIVIGDQVELWGASISVSTVAMQSDTIAYELLTRVSARRSSYIYQGAK